jgi:hypothetical protein
MSFPASCEDDLSRQITASWATRFTRSRPTKTEQEALV